MGVLLAALSGALVGVGLMGWGKFRRSGLWRRIAGSRPQVAALVLAAAVLLIVFAISAIADYAVNH